jgi:dephospho-CoA kinase
MKHIALVGETGSGKGTFAEHLVEKYGYTHLVFSSFLEKLALEKGFAKESEIPMDRIRKNEVGAEMRKELGRDCLAQRLVKEIEAQPNRNYVVDGARMFVELDTVKKKLGEKIVTVNVRSKADKRAGRIMERDQIGMDGFEKIEESARKHFEIAEMSKACDRFIDNEGTIEEFKGKIDLLMNEINVE